MTIDPRSKRQARRGRISNNKRADHLEEAKRAVEEGALDLEPHDVELTSLEIRAVQLRMSGLTFEEIAKALGWQNKGSAHKAVKRALEKWGWNTVDEYRMLELQRLDALTARVWTRALGRPERRDEAGNVIEEGTPPDLEAMSMVLRLMERRSKLLGLDAPTAIDLGITREEDMGEAIVNAYEEWQEVVGEYVDDDEDVVDAEVVEEEDTSEGVA